MLFFFLFYYSVLYKRLKIRKNYVQACAKALQNVAHKHNFRLIYTTVVLENQRRF